MKQEEIIEGNKLIAKFMGHSQDDHLYGMVIDDKYYTYTLMKYHSSWDWLMPVVEKINNIGSKSSVVLMGSLGQYRVQLFHSGRIRGQSPQGIGVSDSFIEATWFAVVAFITWYNQNKEL